MLMPTEVFKLGSSRLTARVTEHGPHLVVALRGKADGSARETVAEVGERILTHPGTTVAFEMEELEEAWGSGADALVRVAREALRAERRVVFVRCREALFTQLRDAGLRGRIQHLPSLAAATEGAVQDGVQTITLHFQSQARCLTKVRTVLRAVTRRAGFSPAAQDDVLMAVVEASTNAILHGSPPNGEGRISLCIYLGPASLVVDVADEGGGFTPGGLEPPDLEDPAEHGYGLFIIRRVMDSLEVFNSDCGTVVRMTKSLTRATEGTEWRSEEAVLGGRR
jgi:serine/threonine-protein kinase RsbW